MNSERRVLSLGSRSVTILQALLRRIIPESLAGSHNPASVAVADCLCSWMGIVFGRWREYARSIFGKEASAYGFASKTKTSG